jgi:hypothetical protein
MINMLSNKSIVSVVIIICILLASTLHYNLTMTQFFRIFLMSATIAIFYYDISNNNKWIL